MSKKRSNKISTIGSKITTVVSVALVLLIVGIILIISVLTSDAGDAMLQHVAVVVRMADDATPEQTKALGETLGSQPYTAKVEYSSPDDILSEESQLNGEILSLLDQNPYTGEYELFLKPEYVNSDSIVAISQSLSARPGVAEVYSQIDVVNNINDFLRNATFVLSIVALVFLIISIVLLVNTISLVIYSRRFVIHTMQLVGATRAFVRRPFVRTGVLLGIASAVLASLMLCGLHVWAMYQGVDSIFFVGWLPTLAVCGVMVIAGVLLCGIASCIATNRFLNSSYDDLHRM